MQLVGIQIYNLTDGDSSIDVLLKKIGGHWFFLNVNVTCVDLVSFILIFHLLPRLLIGSCDAVGGLMQS